MNYPKAPRRVGAAQAAPAHYRRTDDSADAPISGDDLLGDLDPGWLRWSREQAGR